MARGERGNREATVGADEKKQAMIARRGGRGGANADHDDDAPTLRADSDGATRPTITPLRAKRDFSKEGVIITTDAIRSGRCLLHSRHRHEIRTALADIWRYPYLYARAKRQEARQSDTAKRTLNPPHSECLGDRYRCTGTDR